MRTTGIAQLVLPLLAVPLFPGVGATQAPPAGDTPADTSSGADRATAPLVADRPDFTESTLTVSAGRVQVESGYTFSRRERVREHAIGEVLARIGIAGPLELRLAPGSYRVVEGAAGSRRGLDDPAIGAKAALVRPAPDMSPLLPSVAVLASSSLPVGHESVSPAAAEPEAALALGWAFGGLSLGVNLKRARPVREGGRFGRTAASVAAGASALPGVDAYLEYYTLRPRAPGSGAEDVLNGGLTLLLGPNLQLDARAGSGLVSGAPDLIFGIGLSVRR